jgi:hypothetical protein
VIIYVKDALRNVENEVHRVKCEAAAFDFNGYVEEMNNITFLMC